GGRELYGNRRQGEGMGQWGEFMRALGSHDAGKTGGGDHVAFLGVAGSNQRQRRPPHLDGTLGNRDAVGYRLSADVDHVGGAGFVDMRQPPRHDAYPAAAGWASSLEVAAATSASRIRLSPTRYASMP